MMTSLFIIIVHILVVISIIVLNIDEEKVALKFYADILILTQFLVIFCHGCRLFVEL